MALVSNARMRVLNRSYRRKDYATDVLSFPADAPDPQPAPTLPRRGSRVAHPAPRLVLPALGDIVIATGVAKQQAREAGHSHQTELRMLALHGLLHLLGYDHEAPDDNGRMRRAEIRLRKKGGLRLGLMERAHEAEKRPRAGVGPREPEKRLRLRLSGGRAAARSAAREGARAGVGPREPKK